MVFDKKKYVFIGSLLLMLLVLISSITIYLKNNNEWDVSLFSGLIRESIDLDEVSKKELSDMINSMELIPIVDVSTLGKTILYGGKHYEVLFEKNNITNQWILTANVTHQTIYRNNVVIEENYYEKDMETINKITNFINYKRKK